MYSPLPILFLFEVREGLPISQVKKTMNIISRLSLLAGALLVIMNYCLSEASDPTSEVLPNHVQGLELTYTVYSLVASNKYRFICSTDTIAHQSYQLIIINNTARTPLH